MPPTAPVVLKLTPVPFATVPKEANERLAEPVPVPVSLIVLAPVSGTSDPRASVVAVLFTATNSRVPPEFCTLPLTPRLIALVSTITAEAPVVGLSFNVPWSKEVAPV